MVTSEQYSLSFCMCCMCFEFLRPNISIQSSKLFIDARNCCRLNLQALGSSNTTVVENFYVCIEKHVLWKNTQTNNFKVWKKSDSDIPTALILMVSSRPCAFFLQETWLQRMLSPSLTLMWMRLSNKKNNCTNPSVKWNCLKSFNQSVSKFEKKESETCSCCYISVAMTGSELNRKPTDKLHHQHDFQRPWASMSHMDLMIWICPDLSKPFTNVLEMSVLHMDGCGWNLLYIIRF